MIELKNAWLGFSKNIKALKQLNIFETKKKQLFFIISFLELFLSKLISLSLYIYKSKYLNSRYEYILKLYNFAINKLTDNESYINIRAYIIK